MKKNEIITAILRNCRDVNGKKYRKDDVQDIINYFVESMKHALRNRDKVVIRGFGTFEIRHRKSKESTCVRTGEKIMTREKDHVAFVPSNDFDLDSLT